MFKLNTNAGKVVHAELSKFNKKVMKSIGSAVKKTASKAQSEYVKNSFSTLNVKRSTITPTSRTYSLGLGRLTSVLAIKRKNIPVFRFGSISHYKPSLKKKGISISKRKKIMVKINRDSGFSVFRKAFAIITKKGKGQLVVLKRTGKKKNNIELAYSRTAAGTIFSNKFIPRVIGEVIPAYFLKRLKENFKHFFKG